MNISGHILDRTYGLVILLLIPIAVTFFKKSYKSTVILGVLFFLSFAEGSLQLLGLEPSYNRLIRDVLIIVSFFSIYRSSGGRMNLPGINIIWGLIILSVVSFIFNSTNSLQFILFVRRLGINFLLMYYVANIKFTQKTFKNLFSFIIGLFIIQIPISFIKLIMFGIGEDYIGSVSTIAGSITTSLTLLATVYILTKILYTGKRKYIILFFLFIFFAVTGAKRATFIFVPLIVFLGLFYSKKIKLKRFLLILFMVPFSLIFIFKTTPSLNPENEIWGSFDPGYVIGYFYAREDAALSANASNSRVLVFNYLLHNVMNGPQDIILGHGPGIVFPKNRKDRQKYGIGEQYVLNKYGLGYGLRLGALWLFFQMGLFFVVLYFLYNYYLYKRIKEKVDDKNLLFIRLLFSVFLMDTLLYSSSFITPSAISITFYSILGFYLNNRSRLSVVF